MSKDKRKKKFFQGMEHLREDVNRSQFNPAVQSGGTLGGNQLEHTYIKKDLLGVLVLMGLILIILVGLTIVDKRTDKLTQFAEKITSVVIK